MVKVSASILSANFTYLKGQINNIPNSDYLHLLIMDGHFLPKLSFGSFLCKTLKSINEKPLMVHLAVTHPSKWIDQFAEYADTIIFHEEIDNYGEKAEEIINQVHSKGKKVGLAIKAKTPVGRIKQYLKNLDLVLVMTSNFDEEFIEETKTKFQTLRDLQKELEKPFKIAAFGGINLENKEKIDADILVVGDYVFKSSQPADAIGNLKGQSKLDSFI